MERRVIQYFCVCIWLIYALFSGVNCSAGSATSDGLSSPMACLGANANTSTAFQPVRRAQSSWLPGKGCMTLTSLASVASFLFGRYTAHGNLRGLAAVAAGVLFRSAARPLVRFSKIASSWFDTLLASMPAVAARMVEQSAGLVSPHEGACQETVTSGYLISTCRNNSRSTIQSIVNNDGCAVNTGSDDPASDSTSFASSSNNSSNSSSSNNSTNSGEQIASMPSHLGTEWVCVFSDTADSRNNSSSSNAGAAAAAEPRFVAVDTNNACGGSHISMGVLLGAGKFGKVYQGSWRGSPVAVKVITQLGSHEAQLSRREAELMLQAKHPNVVQTYHVVIWQRRNLTGSRINSRSANNTSSSSFGKLVLGSPGATISSNCNSSSEGFKSAELSGSPHANGACAAAGGQCRIVSAPAAAETAHCWPVGDSGGECELEFEGGQITRDIDLETQTWMVQELCDGGTLDDAARDNKVDNSMAQVSCLLDISRGMHYLHSSNIMHGDLKCSNICLRKKHHDLARVLSSSSSSSSANDDLDAPQFSCKVADFSLTRTVDAGKDHHSTNSLGTVTHLAPELLNDGRQTPACDVYSFGMLVWELLHKKSPFTDCLHEVEVLEKIIVKKERPAWNHQDQSGLTAGPIHDLIRLAEQCWDQDPSKRPTFAEICNRLQQMQQDLSTTAVAAAARASAGNRASVTRYGTVWPHRESGLQASADSSVNVIVAAAAAAPYEASASSSSSSSNVTGSITGLASESASSSASHGVQMCRSHSLGTSRLSRIGSSELESIPELQQVTTPLSASRFSLVQGRRSADVALLSRTNASSAVSSSGGRWSSDIAMPEDMAVPFKEAASQQLDKEPTETPRMRRHGQLITDSTTGQLIIDAPLGSGYDAFARWLLGAEGVAELQKQQQQRQMKRHGLNHPVTTSHVRNHLTSPITSSGKGEAATEGTKSQGGTWIPRASSEPAGKPAAPHSGWWE